MPEFSKEELEDAKKLFKNSLIDSLNNKNIMPDKVYTFITNYPNKGDEISFNGSQLLETQNAYLSLFEAEKSGNKQQIFEAITRITNLK